MKELHLLYYFLSNKQLFLYNPHSPSQGSKYIWQTKNKTLCICICCYIFPNRTYILWNVFMTFFECCIKIRCSGQWFKDIASHPIFKGSILNHRMQLQNLIEIQEIDISRDVVFINYISALGLFSSQL
jgi:hypothetical protein